MHNWSAIELTDLSPAEGKQLAIDNGSKYVEVSCAISHNVNLLLAGIAALINPSISKSNKSGEYPPATIGLATSRRVEHQGCVPIGQVSMFWSNFGLFV